MSPMSGGWMQDGGFHCSVGLDVRVVAGALGARQLGLRRVGPGLRDDLAGFRAAQLQVEMRALGDRTLQA